MSFVLPDLVIEDVIRKGINAIKANALPVKSTEREVIIDREFKHTIQSDNELTIDGSNSTTQFSFTLTGWEEVASANFPGGLESDELGFKEVGNDNLFYYMSSLNAKQSMVDIGISVVDPANNTAANNVINEDVIITSIVLSSPATGQLTFTFTLSITSALVTLANRVGPFNEYSLFLTLTGFTSIRASAERLLDMIFDFNSLPNQGGIQNKYIDETSKILRLIAKDDIAIVHSFNEVPARLPCISIQLANDDEDERIALNTDFGGVVESGTHIGRDENVIHANYSLMIGCHTKEPLMTKYLYTLIKYFLLSEKLALEAAGMIVPSFRGSDFKRNLDYGGDQVYTRFITMTGKTIDSWLDIDEVIANIASVSIETYVGKDTTNIGSPSFGIVGSGGPLDPSTNAFRTRIPVIDIEDFESLQLCVRAFIIDNTLISGTFVIKVVDRTGALPVDIFQLNLNPGATALETANIIVDAVNNVVPGSDDPPYVAAVTTGRDGLIVAVTICTSQTDERTFEITGVNNGVIIDSDIFQSRGTLSRIRRDLSNLNNTVVERDDVRITGIDIPNAEIEVESGAINGKWLPGSQVTVANANTQYEITTPVRTAFSPLLTVQNPQGNINGTTAFRVNKSEIPSGFSFQVNDLLVINSSNTGGTISTLITSIIDGALQVTLNISIVATDLEIGDTIVSVNQIDVAISDSLTIKTRPDTIFLGGTITKTAVFGGKNSQTIRTGLSETYTDNSDSTNNNPSPVD